MILLPSFSTATATTTTTTTTSSQLAIPRRNLSAKSSGRWILSRKLFLFARTLRIFHLDPRRGWRNHTKPRQFRWRWVIWRCFKHLKDFSFKSIFDKTLARGLSKATISTLALRGASWFTSLILSSRSLASQFFGIWKLKPVIDCWTGKSTPGPMGNKTEATYGGTMEPWCISRGPWRLRDWVESCGS